MALLKRAYTIDPLMALNLRAIGLSNKQIGVVLAAFANRPMPYQPYSVSRALADTGARRECP